MTVDRPTATEELLGRLVAHPTESRSPNRALIDEVAERCAALGGRITLVDGHGALVDAPFTSPGASPASLSRGAAASPGEHGDAEPTAGATGRSSRHSHASGAQVNLLVAFGPDEPGGLMLSGHSDVVPAGTGWSSDPYLLTPIDGERLAGRGTADMKGFIASAICALERWVSGGGRFDRPLRFALSFDEEIGCVGVRGLIEHLAHDPLLADSHPDLVLIGEPSMMRPRHRHLGKLGYDTLIRSEAAHSSLSYRVPSAISVAARIITALDEVGSAALGRTRLAARSSAGTAHGVGGQRCSPDTGDAETGDADTGDAAFGEFGAVEAEVGEPDATVNVGVIDGGTGLNVVAERCRFTFELRNAFERDPDAELASVWAAVDAERARLAAVGGGIDLVETVRYPALAADTTHPWMRLIERLAAAGPFTPIGFGTEGGLFASALGAAVAICGPGDIAVAHRPDEYVTRLQLARCDSFLDSLLAAVVAPVRYRHRP